MISRDIYLDKLKLYKDNDLIKIISGVRRCGKSTLLKLYKDYLISSGILNENIIFINFELMEYDSIRDYKTLYSFIKNKMNNEYNSSNNNFNYNSNKFNNNSSNSNKFNNNFNNSNSSNNNIDNDAEDNPKYYIFLDEIQQVANWEKAVNSLNIDSNVDIYITGSNAYLLSSELATLLSGRYAEIKMLPLSFKEFSSSNHLDSNLIIDEKFQEYLKFGSLPQITSLPQNEEIINDFLSGVYDAILIKDIVSRANITNITLIKDILKYVILNTGNLISAKKISDYLKHEYSKQINSTTISNYLDILEKAFILYKAPRYNIKGKEILKSLAKYYVVDTGIRNFLLGYSDTDFGHILENIVYLELIRQGYQVFVGKCYNKEIDFIAIKPNDRKYFQVTTTIKDSKLKKRELDPLKSVKDNYDKILLSLDKTYLTDNEGIEFKNIFDFLLE